jgi:tight adherence protein C
VDFIQATIDQLTNFFVQLSGNTSWFVLVVIFLAVFMSVVAIATVIAGRSPVERRLAGQGVDALVVEAGKEETLRRHEREAPWNKLLGVLEKHLAPSESKAISILRQRMIHAGFFAPTALRNYLIIRVICTVGFPTAFIVWMAVVPTGIPINMSFIFLGVLAFVGYILPRAVLDRKVQMRQTAVQEGFPDALDMMVVCVEAGLGLDASFNRVGTQMAPSYPVLAQHFGVVALELRAGKSREEALRGFATRVGLPEINSFVTLMVQSDQLGTSIAQTLRVHSEEMRIKRMLRAEEKAHRLPVMLAIPLVVGILPCMMTVALLPSIIRIMRVLLPTLSGNG